jgi:hypothetical protein
MQASLTNAPMLAWLLPHVATALRPASSVAATSFSAATDDRAAGAACVEKTSSRLQPLPAGATWDRPTQRSKQGQ